MSILSIRHELSFGILEYCIFSYMYRRFIYNTTVQDRRTHVILCHVMCNDIILQCM